MAAYREAAVIEAKVADTLANGYAGDVDVLVVADDELTAAAARRTPARVIEPGARQGKAAALNLGVREATGEVVVLTDANAFLAPGSLAAMVRWFDDPTIDAVAGEKRVAEEGEGAYWRYESWLKEREFAAGTTIAVVGEVAAVRRSAWRDIPPDCAVDDLWIAFDVVEGGGRIAYEPAASASEDPNERLADDWERRTRILTGMLDVCWRRRALLGPSSPIAVQLWGHKVLRSTVGPLAHLLLLLRAVRAARHSPLAALFVLGHALAGGGIAARASGRPVPKPLRPAAQVALLQAVALGGMARYLRGSRPALWPKPERVVR